MEKPKRINIKITLSIIASISEDCLAYYQEHEADAIEALCSEEEKSVLTVEVVEDEAHVDWYAPAIEEREGTDPTL